MNNTYTANSRDEVDSILRLIFKKDIGAFVFIDYKDNVPDTYPATITTNIKIKYEAGN